MWNTLCIEHCATIHTLAPIFFSDLFPFSSISTMGGIIFSMNWIIMSLLYMYKCVCAFFPTQNFMEHVIDIRIKMICIGSQWHDSIVFVQTFSGNFRIEFFIFFSHCCCCCCGCYSDLSFSFGVHRFTSCLGTNIFSDLSESSLLTHFFPSLWHNSNNNNNVYKDRKKNNWLSILNLQRTPVQASENMKFQLIPSRFKFIL